MLRVPYAIESVLTACGAAHIYAYHTINTYAIPLTFPFAHFLFAHFPSAHFPAARCLFLDSDYIHC